LHRDDRWRISIHAVGANAKGTLGVARSRTDISSCFTLQGLGDTVFSLCLLTSPGVDPPESRVLIREHGWRFDSSGFRVRTSVPGSAGKRIEQLHPDRILAADLSKPARARALANQDCPELRLLHLCGSAGRDGANGDGPGLLRAHGIPGPRPHQPD